ncbi:MAG: Mur ligase family protein, partial [Mailhella sp.]
MQLEKAALACGAKILHFSPAVLTGAASDSRNVRRGDLFTAIRGERADGHDFARTAVSNGASAVLAQRDPFQGEPLSPVLLVEDSVKALGCISHAWRKEFKGKVIGITGTAGKTTTKELLAHILSLHGKTARTPMNLNSQIGMPISIMAADGDEDFWVMEAGISHPEDMDELGPILEPDMAIILNAGTGHSLGLGDRGTAYYKARLLAHRKKGSVSLVCADYDDLAREARMLCPETVFFSALGREAPYRVAYMGLDEKARGQYRLWLEEKEVDVTCALSG